MTGAAAAAAASTHHVVTACKAKRRPRRAGHVTPVRSRPQPRGFHAANVRLMPQRRAQASSASSSGRPVVTSSSGSSCPGGQRATTCVGRQPAFLKTATRGVPRDDPLPLDGVSRAV